ncbi:MAG TPA: RAMP superfamily CRISPR-associated protein [candidate division Zixibacteria bacterium]|nr:RAMP superfamily CRISPR-associated protein [candidate division Zixibacteria bacterium]HUU88058.1 RAMP superfamily CRISPR-associated protein [Candidatus Glassbacteria bacterium]
MIVSRKFKRIKIVANTPIAKPGNGQISGGKINNLLLISNGTEEKEGKIYLIKGLRGLLNHSMMALAKQKGVEVCHSSDKEETQSGEKLLPSGFHPNGACYPENECIRHRLMGSINKQSVLRFEPVVIVSASGNTKNTTAQKIHIATEKRNSLVQGSKRAIQDFGERYVSGEFTLIIELLKEITQEELGFLLQSILFMSELGFGGSVNNGAGKIILEEVALQEVERTRTIKKGKVVEEEKERNLWKEMEEAMNSW